MSIVINGMDMPKGNSTKNLLIYSDGRVFTGHKDDVNYFAEELPSAQPQTGQAEPLELQFEQVGTHIIKTCPTCHTPWRVPPTSEYLKIAKYPCCPCGQRIRWEWRDE